MKHGNKTIQYSIYDRTSGGKPTFITDTTSIKRPSLEIMTESMKGAGIAGEIDLPSMGQLGALSYEIGFKRTNKEAVKLFEQKTQHLETRWVTDVLDATDSKLGTCANKEIVKGIPKSLDLGSLEGNSANEATVTLEILYYKFIQDGVTLIEIDKLNNVFIVNGTDYAKKLREAL